MEDIEVFLRELRGSPSTVWVANEIDETLSQGVTMNAKDAVGDSGFFDLIHSQDISAKERNKRQKYETSRPFKDEEKVDVVFKALEILFLDLPSIRYSAIKNLKEFDFDIDVIVFSSSDDELIDQYVTHEISFDEVNQNVNAYKKMHNDFLSELEK